MVDAARSRAENSESASHSFWRGKRVFLTGHTGFKGGWLALWLQKLGAVVHGYSLPPPTDPSLFALASVEAGLSNQIGDIRDGAALVAAVGAFRPDIVLHLAAQPLLRLSYDEPVDTYATNVMGTVHLLEAVRRSGTARVTLVITTDKCYENREQIWPYRETDPMGGHDPYSSSKGCAELVTSAYGRSYFSNGQACVASVRAGNVIGGGDWARDRLMTDIVAAFRAGHSPEIRNPAAVRPWQHVLEPLSGYLRAAEYLWDVMPRTPEAWNFGPEAEGEVTVARIVSGMADLWGVPHEADIVPDARHLHEAHLLRLDSSKARVELGWRPRLALREALALTVEWYKALGSGADMRAVTLDQIGQFERADDTRPDNRLPARAAG